MKVKYLAIHCAATPPSRDIGAKEIEAWHKKRGWKGIGYHYVIRRDGTVETGRAENEIGAHVKGFNSQSLGICLVGGISETGKAEANYTKMQAVSLAGLLTDLTKKYPDAIVQGHRDFPNQNKACPCFDAGKWWERNVWGKHPPPLI